MRILPVKMMILGRPGEASLGLGDIDLNAATIKWLKGAKGLFYAFHGYVNSPEVRIVYSK